MIGSNVCSGTVIRWARDKGYTSGRAEFWLLHDGATHDRLFSASYESALREAGYQVTVVPNQGKGAAATRIEAARRRGGEPIAGALNFIGANCLNGRYWGAIEDVPNLHFEICYYQTIETAIAMGLQRVEAVAQGSQKLARGYRPVPTWSAHYIADRISAARRPVI